MGLTIGYPGGDGHPLGKDEDEYKNFKKGRGTTPIKSFEMGGKPLKFVPIF